MKCFNCGADLKDSEYCSQCGADVKLYSRMLKLSNAYYNEGLEKAKIRDLSGAVLALRESLKINKKNTNARNLLGLVYFEMGMVVDALTQWIITAVSRARKIWRTSILRQFRIIRHSWTVSIPACVNIIRR